MLICGCLIYTRNDAYMFVKFKQYMILEFDMSDLGKLHYFHSIEIVQTTAGIFVSQKKYVQEMFERFEMKGCNYVNPRMEQGMKLNKDHGGKKVDILYNQIVGSLIYLITTRSNIMYVVCLLSKYMEIPTAVHLLVAKRIFQYLNSTADFGLFYRKGGEVI